MSSKQFFHWLWRHWNHKLSEKVRKSKNIKLHSSTTCFQSKRCQLHLQHMPLPILDQKANLKRQNPTPLTHNPSLKKKQTCTDLSIFNFSKIRCGMKLMGKWWICLVFPIETDSRNLIFPCRAQEPSGEKSENSSWKRVDVQKAQHHRSRKHATSLSLSGVTEIHFFVPLSGAPSDWRD